MKIKYLVIIGLIFTLSGCGKSATELQNAIKLSSDGLSLIAQSEKPKAKEEDKEKLLKEGNDKLSESKELYLELISQEPENGQYHNNLGWLQLKMNDLSGAASSLENAKKHRASIHPDSALDNNIEELNQLLSNKQG